MNKLLILCLLYGFSLNGIYAQSRIIKGVIINDYLENMPGVSITIDDTVEVGGTDLNGVFQISIPASVKKLSFGAVGLEVTSIELADECSEVELVMMLRSTYDFMTLKKVDRLRIKRFRNLPKLHKEAFEKGIFKTDKGCYTREFIPDNEKKRK